MNSIWIIIGAISGLITVGIGAFGAHGLKEILQNEWDVSSIPNFSDQEIRKIYSIPSSKNSNLALFRKEPGFLRTNIFFDENKSL